MKLFIGTLLILINFSNVFAQNNFGKNSTSNCGSSELMNDLFRNNSSIKSLHFQIEQKLANLKNSGQLRNSLINTTVSLPVVVHIIHNNGAENISDARVLAGIQHLNEAFANTSYYDQGNGVNTNIQFCLAQRDPNNNPTNGITRNVSTYTNMGGTDYSTDDIIVKNLNRWNPKCYINIWLVNNIPGPVAGYAYLPSAAGSAVDGIVAEAQYFGNSNPDDVLIIHEVGHYLGLYHTFEGGCSNSNCVTDGDKVCDTPPDNSTVSTGCSTPVNSCSTDMLSGFSSDQNDLTTDYLDYGNWSCMSVFTQGQADRMNWFINNVRNSLLSCKSCLPPCPAPVIANFNPSATTVNAGTNINFSNYSVNGVTYQWYLNNVLQSSSFNYSTVFNTPGQFTIKLIVAGNNTTLCDTSFKEQLIIVNCPVTANFSNSATEIPVGQSITFTNNSTGSPLTSAWYINNTLMVNTPGFTNQFVQAGTFNITLTVGNGICTSSKTITIDVSAPCQPNSYFEKLIASPTMTFAPQQTLILPDSSIMVLGSSVTVPTYTDNLAIIKLTKNGNLIWSRNYYNGIRMAPHRIIQLQDGNFVVAGLRAISGLNYETFVMKIDNAGSVIWKKSFAFSGVTDFYFANTSALTEVSPNGIILGISLERTSVFESRTFLMRLDQTGNLLWNKEVTPASSVTALYVKNNAVYGVFENGTVAPQMTFFSKIDIANGNVISSKKYSVPTNMQDYTHLQIRNMDFFNNNFKLYGTIGAGGAGIGDTASHVMIVADTFGTIQTISRIRFTDPQLFITNNLPAYYRHGTMLKNGEFSFVEMGKSPLFPFTQKIFLAHASTTGNLISSNQVLADIPTNFHYSPTLNGNKDNIKDRGNGNLIITVYGQPTIQGNVLPGLIVYSSDYTGSVTSNCPITNGPTRNLPTNTITTQNSPEFSLIPAPFTVNPVFSFQDSAIQYNSYNICSTPSTASCYSLKINLPDTLCVTNDSITIVCNRNPGCTERLDWSISSPANNSFTQVNDSTIKVKFTSYGNYTVVAKLSSCSSINDTAQIFVAKNASLLSLGPDKNLCTFSTSILNVGSGFKSYKWNTGSNDSTITAYDAGQYIVSVQDFCNNIKSDTVLLTQVSAPVFNLPADITICSIDTVNLLAPSGFTNYNWGSNYNINTTQGQSVRIWPRTDTVYTATANFGNACTVVDSIRIFVKNANPVNIGSDSSFCMGDSIRLVAATGFSSYQWNTGAISPAIFVSQPGYYSIITTNANGCVSKDTMQVISLYAKPVINLGPDTNLCKNEIKVLNAGSGFSSYTWQNNTNDQYFTVSNIGTYWVQVTDIRGCRGLDSLLILSISDTAVNIIDPTFEVCANNPSYIKSTRPFNNYLWSTGSSADSVLITQPGIYTLTITNNAGCKSSENFRVYNKECFTDILFPNTFTPNDDRNNETFKALGFVNFESYKLEIFNRYGSKIFTSRDQLIGWNGTWKGVKQELGTYVWICTYKLRGVTSMMKGTVLLLR